MAKFFGKNSLWHILCVVIKRAEQTLISLEESCRYCERFLKLKELSGKARAGDKGAAEKIFDIIDEL